MFPKISHLNDLLPFIEGNKQIRVKKCEETGNTVVCYMVQDEDTFRGENELYERECRGITFAPDGTVAARTMTKFFNIGEREETLPEKIDWRNVVRIMEKRDGSMVTPVKMIRASVHAPRFKFKTKKSFTTQEAALADRIANSDLDKVYWITNILDGGYTPTFEITSPKFPIVVQYEKDELTLLHIRDNVTGQYLTEDEIKFLNPPFPIVENVIKDFSWTFGDGGAPYTEEVRWDLLKAAAETVKGMEGWVIQFSNGEMVKLKTSWYNELHHSVTFTRWRDIARTVIADKSDDLKSAFSMVGRDIEPILKVERTIKTVLTSIEEEVKKIIDLEKDMNSTVKDVAIKYRGHKYFGQIMTMFRGAEVNWIEYYEKNHINDWGLEVV